MQTYFLFLDECYDSTSTIASLTGVLVPVTGYPELRTGLYDLLDWTIRPEPNVVGRPPELHGSDLLRDEDDERKLEVLKGVADLVVEQNHPIYRVGYYITREIEQTFPQDPKLVGMCWLSLLFMLEPVLAQSMVIPVMDGFHPRTVNSLSGPSSSINMFRAAGLEKIISVPHSANILGEVFFADSEHSVGTQLVDVISYLRHVTDLKNDGKPLSEFKSRLLEISNKLEPAIAREEIIALRLDGVVQGPAIRARPSSSSGPLTAASRTIPSD